MKSSFRRICSQMSSGISGRSTFLRVAMMLVTITKCLATQIRTETVVRIPSGIPILTRSSRATAEQIWLMMQLHSLARDLQMGRYEILCEICWLKSFGARNFKISDARLFMRSHPSPDQVHYLSLHCIQWATFRLSWVLWSRSGL